MQGVTQLTLRFCLVFTQAMSIKLLLISFNPNNSGGISDQRLLPGGGGL